MPIQIRDDRNRVLTFSRAPKRVLSLVPSDTYTIAKLVSVSALVGRTTFCHEPSGELDAIPTVGGTKDYDVEKILDLQPEVVIANQEENTKQTLEKLAQEAIPVFVVFPRRVEDSVSLIARYARLLHLEGEPHVKELLRRCHRALETQRAVRGQMTPIRAFCPIWMDPLMTVHGDTYISDSLDLAGAQNVFADRERRYPLAADLGKRAKIDPGQRDVRYPRVTFDEVVERKPDVVLLPDEPHPFTAEDAAKFTALGLPRVVHLNGKDVCWYGAWVAEGIPRLAAALRA